MAKISTYECRKCGTKVVVTKGRGSNLQPIYCCGMEAAKADDVARQLGEKAKESGKKGRAKGQKVTDEAAKKPAAAPRTVAEKKGSKGMRKR